MEVGEIPYSSRKEVLSMAQSLELNLGKITCLVLLLHCFPHLNHYQIWLWSENVITSKSYESKVSYIFLKFGVYDGIVMIVYSNYHLDKYPKCASVN